MNNNTTVSLEEAKRLMSIEGFVVNCGVFININSTGNGGQTYGSKVYLDYDEVLGFLDELEEEER